MAGVNDDSNVTISPPTHTALRITNIVTGAIGVLFTTIYGFANFDTRMDVTRSDLYNVREAMDKGRTQWPGATVEDRGKLLTAMATACNAQDVTERVVPPTQTAQQPPANPDQRVADISKKITDAIAAANATTGTPTPQEKDAIKQKLLDIRSSMAPFVNDPHLQKSTSEWLQNLDKNMSEFDTNVDAKKLIEGLQQQQNKLKATVVPQ